MYITLKIIHFLSFSAGIGVGVASMVLGIRAARAEGPAIGALRSASGALGRIGLGAIILLWVTGVWMMASFHRGSLDGLFLVKIGFVVVLTGLSLDLNIKGARAARGGAPVDPGYAKRSGMIMGAMSLLALVTAVLVFG